MPVGTLSLPLGSVLTGQPEVIGSSVLGAAASAIRFDFPSVYRAVQIEGWLQKDANAGGLFLTLNGDTGNNYAQQAIGCDGATVTGARSTARANIDMGGSISGLGANGVASFTILVVKTTAAAKAQVVLLNGITQTNLEMELMGGEWGNTSDLLNRIDLSTATPDFAANTSITLWGWRR